jgi:DNA-binding protein YbaB
MLGRKIISVQIKDDIEDDNDFEKLEDILTTLKYSTQELP